MIDRISPWFVAIGASGSEGLQDIQALVAELPVSLQAVVLVVLHRPWDRPSQLRAVLQGQCLLPVRIASDGERFEVGTVYIGEPDEHLTLAARSCGDLVDDPQRTYRNRTVDLLFRSLVEHGGQRIIGVVLSGSLDDGARGLAAIHAAGGLTMVFEPGFPLKKGMPENAIAFDGPIDLIGNAREIANAISDAIGHDQREFHPLKAI